MFTDHGVQIYGISTDTVESHKKFRESLKLPFPLLSDEDAAVSKLYDSVLDHEGQSFSARKIVLVDKAGTVVYRDDEYKVGDKADFAALIAAVDKLEK
jgi:peroxiredoxin Q/BCP